MRPIYIGCAGPPNPRKGTYALLQKMPPGNKMGCALPMYSVMAHGMTSESDHYIALLVGPGSFGIRLLDNHGNIHNGWARCFDRGGPFTVNGITINH